MGTLELTINKYRCEHSFDREHCEFCNPQQKPTGAEHMGGYVVEWEMTDSPLVGELESKEEIILRKAREKQRKEEEKQLKKEKKYAELQYHIFEDGTELKSSINPPLDDLPF